ncbi:MAG TPA: histidinol-phosphate transaminase [Stellaceae bacterium]|nr:histidinol-phosphate transaminase [Stellaceae bacterium]
MTTTILPKPRPGVLDIEPYRGGEAGAPGFAKPIRLASNESALGPSPRAMAAYAALAPEMHRYPDGESGALRQTIARHYGLDAERIVCGNGSDELISLLTKAYAGPGDEVLYSRHGFLMYPIAATAAGAKSVTAPEHDLTADVDALLKAVTPRTRIVFLANPNNPTGTYLSSDEVVRLHAGLPKSALLVIDAAYAEYVQRNDYEPGIALVEANQNVVMTRTFSKIYALAGLRVGWAYLSAPVADVLNRVRNPFNLNAAAQAAAVAALDDVAATDRAREHNDIWLPWLARELSALGLTVNPSVGNFLIARFPTERGRTAADTFEFLKSRGILTRKIVGYGLPEWLRIGVGMEEEMRAVVKAIADFLGQS